MIPSYNSPETDLKSLILSISDMEEWGVESAQIELGSLKSNFRGYNYKIVIQILGSTVNAKYQFDDINYSLLVCGQAARDEGIVHDVAWAVHNELVGRDTTMVGDVSYQNFQSRSVPYRATSTQQDRPIYLMNLSINRQVRNPEGNRTPLN